MQLNIHKYDAGEGYISYTLSGPKEGRLVVPAHGIADSNRSFRLLAPKLNAAGFRTANVDIRGCGESSTSFPSYTRADIAADLIALVKNLDPKEPAVIIGHSISGGAATIAAAMEPALFCGLVKIAPFTQPQVINQAEVSRKGVAQKMAVIFMGSPYLWRPYLEACMPGEKRPDDWDDEKARGTSKLCEDGRMRVYRDMVLGAAVDAEEKLSQINCPVLIIMGKQDCNWPNPLEEGQKIVAKMSNGLGRLELLEGAGHLPQSQYPEETWALVKPFLSEVFVDA